MAVNATHFFSADEGRTSVFKFRVGDDPTPWVWFRYADGSSALYATAASTPYRVEDALTAAPFPDLDSLLAARGTTRSQWDEDLLAQFGERIGWRTP